MDWQALRREDAATGRETDDAKDFLDDEAGDQAWEQTSDYAPRQATAVLDADAFSVAENLVHRFPWMPEPSVPTRVSDWYAEARQDGSTLEQCLKLADAIASFSWAHTKPLLIAERVRSTALLRHLRLTERARQRLMKEVLECRQIVEDLTQRCDHMEQLGYWTASDRDNLKSEVLALREDLIALRQCHGQQTGQLRFVHRHRDQLENRLAVAERREHDALHQLEQVTQQLEKSRAEDRERCQESAAPVARAPDR